MYDHILYRGRKHSCRYFLQGFRTAEKLKCHIKDSFKINGEETIKMSKKGEYIKFKNFGRKKIHHSYFYRFRNIFIPEDNGKQNLNESYTNKYYKTCCL